MPTAWRLRRVSGSAAAALLVATMTLFGSSAAVADSDGDVLVSWDGVVYFQTVPGGFLDQIEISVPGDAQTAGFWVRNAGPVPAYLRIAIGNVVTTDPILATALSINASTAAHPGTEATLAEAEPCRVLTEGDILPPGGTVHVTATLALGDLGGLAGQGGTARFDLQVALSDSVVPLPPTTCSDLGTQIPVTGGDGDIRLARTGSDLPLPVIMGSASILGVGLFLLVAARRRRKAQGWADATEPGRRER